MSRYIGGEISTSWFNPCQVPIPADILLDSTIGFTVLSRHNASNMPVIQQSHFGRSNQTDSKNLRNQNTCCWLKDLQRIYLFQPSERPSNKCFTILGNSCRASVNRALWEGIRSVPVKLFARAPQMVWNGEGVALAHGETLGECCSVVTAYLTSLFGSCNMQPIAVCSCLLLVFILYNSLSAIPRTNHHPPSFFTIFNHQQPFSSTMNHWLSMNELNHSALASTSWFPGVPPRSSRWSTGMSA